MFIQKGEKMLNKEDYGKVVLLIGKVACGKTTYARKIEQQENAFLLSLDELQLDIFGENPTRDQLDSSYSGCSEYQKRLTFKLVSMGVDVYLDWGFWQQSAREQARQDFENKGIKVVQYYFDIPLAIRHQRNDKRNLTHDRLSFKIEPKDIAFFDSFFEEPDIQDNDKIFNL